MKLVCFGLPLAPLLLLEDGHEVLLAVLSPGGGVGARRLRRRLGPDSLYPADAADAERVSQSLRSADLLVSWFWTRRLPGPWLRLARCGSLGVHPSLLPRHRGPNPYFWAIDSGDLETGVTAHWLTEEYDRGDILLQERLAIGSRNSWQLARALDRPSLRVLRRAVRLVESRQIEATVQLEAAATWASEPDDAQLRVDWRWATARVLQRIRALSPVPGLALEYRGLRFFVTRACAATQFPAALAPGEGAVVGANVVVPSESFSKPHRPAFVVRTRDGAIAVERAVLAPESGGNQDSEIGGEELATLAGQRLVLDSRDGGP